MSLQPCAAGSIDEAVFDHLVEERLWCNLWAPQLIQGMKESASLIDSPALVSQDGLDCHCEE
jgi:hypothetical protein